MDYLRAFRFHVLHHSASPRSTPVADVVRWHTDPEPGGRGWEAIGYSWVIDDNGLVVPGRVPPLQPAANSGHNTDTLATLVMGDNTVPGQGWNWSQLHALRLHVLRVAMLFPGIETMGHRDWAARFGKTTECPGLDVRSLLAPLPPLPES